MSKQFGHPKTVQRCHQDDCQNSWQKRRITLILGALGDEILILPSITYVDIVREPSFIASLNIQQHGMFESQTPLNPAAEDNAFQSHLNWFLGLVHSPPSKLITKVKQSNPSDKKQT